MSNKHPGSLALFSWMSKSGLPYVVMAAVFILFFYPLIFADNTLVYKDIVHFAYPMKLYIWKMWGLGEWPFWYPNIFHGTPLLPLMHPGVFYPPSVLFLLNDFNQAFNVYFLFHHLVLMFSVYTLSRYWGVTKIASVFSATTALLGGYFLSLSSIYNQFHSVVWFPLILLFYQKYIAGKGAGYLLSVAMLIAFQVLVGGPESAVLSVLVIYFHSLCFESGEHYLKRTVQILSVIILSLGISAIQWIPTYQFLQHLTRGEGINFSYSTESSLAPRSVADMILPENSQRFFDVEKSEEKAFIKSIYMGLIPCFILLMGVLRFRKDLFVRFWTALFFVGIFFSLGRYNPVYFYFHSWVPLFDLFRFPQKFFFLSAFALVFLCGRGLDQLAEDLSRRNIGWKAPLLVLFVLAALVVMVFVLLNSSRFYETLFFLGVVALVCMAVYFKKLNRQIFLLSFLVLLVLDLMGKNGMLVPFIEKGYYKQFPALAKRIGNGVEEFRVFRDRSINVSEFIEDPKKSNPLLLSKKILSPLGRQLVLREELHHNLGTIYGIAYADGKETMLLNDSALWENVFTASKPERKKIILMRSNVKYRVEDDYEVSPSREMRLGIKKLEEFSDTLPRAFLVGQFIHGRIPHLLNTYYDPNFDPLTEVLLDENENITWTPNNKFSGQVERIEYAPNRVSIETNQNSEGMLVLLDTYFPGWQVEVDGKPDQIFRANYFYRGVKLSPGPHKIEFSYIPEGFKTGARISLLTLVFILSGLIFFRFKKSREF